MFKWIKDWWFWFVGYEEPIVFESEEELIAEKSVPQKRSKKPKRSIKTLKKEVDAIWEHTKAPDYIDRNGCSINVQKDVIKALRAVGVFAFQKEEFELYFGDGMCHTYEFVGNGLPAVAYVANNLNYDDGDSVDSTYAYKLEKKQYRGFVEWIDDDEELYEVGHGCIGREKAECPKKFLGKMSWACFYYAINSKTGRSRLLKHRSEDVVHIPHRDKRGHFVRYMSYQQVRMVSVNDGMKEGDQDWFHDDKLATLLNIWAMRDSHWQVRATRKDDDHKVVMCIPQNDAKYYFKDREIEDGRKRKAIYHWVKAHKRKTKYGISNVKTHFRGNKRFSWGSYDIEICLPGYDRPEATSLQMRAHTVEFDEDVSKYKSMDKFIKEIAV